MKINSVTIVGGTHGNEYTGIYLLKHWQDSPASITRASFKTDTLFANHHAFRDNKRYLDVDLNRQFLSALLDDPQRCNREESRAKVINNLLGPKGDAKSDFIIDLHNTTSNMGPSLILLQADTFNLGMAVYVKNHMPEAVIIMEDQIPLQEHPYLCSISAQGVIVEVGPQPQSVLRQDVFDWMQQMTQHILDYVHRFNTNALPDLSNEIEAFAYTETLKLPENEKGERLGMVHSNVQDKDFQVVKPGQPIIKCFDGTDMCWQGDYDAYPHFINEAAYYNNNLAMSMAKKISLKLPG